MSRKEYQAKYRSDKGEELKLKEKIRRLERKIKELQELAPKVEYQNLEEISKRNYDSIVKRGLISKKTTIEDFYNKIFEEYKEVGFEIKDPIKYREFMQPHEIDKKKLGLELADITLVCMNFAKFMKIDFWFLLVEKISINEKRED